MALYRDEAVVLRTYKLGEADRIIVFFTRNHGQVRAVAKGVRRTKSKFGGRLEPGSTIACQFYEGRNLDIVTQAETVALQPVTRGDLERYGRSAVLLEVVDFLSKEGEANQALYRLLTGALTELERAGNPLVVPAFVAKVLVLEGVQPLLDRCVRCGADTNIVTIDISQGGVLCRDCRSGEPISSSVRTVLQALLDGKVRQVLETCDSGTATELEALASRMIEQHLERRLRSSVVLAEHLLA